MIIVTGAAGFIGSNLVKKLNNEGHDDLILVDDFSHGDLNKNLEGKKFVEKINTTVFIEWFKKNANSIDCIYHLGAKTDTTITDIDIFLKLNFNYTKDVWNICTEYKIPLVYASSAATYGNGENGYIDSHEIVEKLEPLNPYAVSKNDFDKWALKQEKTPPHWYGLKFFNVYGPNEYHKGRMSSVVIHAFNQIQKEGKVTLFRSHNKNYKDGQQLRDFVYVKDLVNACLYFGTENPTSGLYNIGTGKARTFYDLAKSVFIALDKEPEIDFVDTPIDIREKYQYFTEADMTKLVETGYSKKFSSLEEGIQDYVQNYLIKGDYE